VNSPDAEAQQLIAAVTSLRAVVESARLPLAIDGAADADVARLALLRQLDDYVLPRLRAIDAPLLAVVGGSTGAGKSTLVNSIVGARGEPSGRSAADDDVARPGAPPG
jgi:ABC-type transport system involved in cytochrome bd biosynthesis fused ATPase/permease subunit